MTSTITNHETESRDRKRRDRPSPAKWAALALGLLSLLALHGLALPWLTRTLQGEVGRHIEARGLEPDGLFYSETDEVAEAYNYFRSGGELRARADRNPKGKP